MSNIPIPPVALEAAARALAKQRLDYDVWDTVLDRSMKYFYTEDARAACLALIQSWPGMKVERDIWWNDPRTIHLPIQQENSNERE